MEKKKENPILMEVRKEIAEGSFVEGALIRPGILTLAFLSFVGALLLLAKGDLKWGGSLILFSFIMNLYSIYQSLTDEPSMYKNLNLGFKLALFIAEVILFNWILTLILY